MMFDYQSQEQEMQKEDDRYQSEAERKSRSERLTEPVYQLQRL